MVKKIIEMLMEQYGRSEEKEAKKLLASLVFSLLFLYFIVINIFPKGIQYYFGCIEIAMMIAFISQYFFKKRKMHINLKK